MNGREVLSNIIASQIDTHKKFGGVVPEVASRMHIEAVDSVVKAALLEAGISIDDVDAIGVTYGPGLVWGTFGWASIRKRIGIRF